MRILRLTFDELLSRTQIDFFMDSATSDVKIGQELMEGGRFSGTKSSKVSTMVFVSGESVCVCVF